MLYRYYNRYDWDNTNNQLFWQGPLDYHNINEPNGGWTPLQLENEDFSLTSNYDMGGPHPYPNPFYNHMLPPKPPIYYWLSHFYDEDGKFDFNKMTTTFGQITNTVKQVSPLIKSFGAFWGKIQ